MHAAAVARKAGEPLVIEEVIVAPPKSHEVRIRIMCTSLCNSDIAFWKMKVMIDLMSYDTRYDLINTHKYWYIQSPN